MTGNQVKSFRDKWNLTQVQLAVRTNSSPARIYMNEARGEGPITADLEAAILKLQKELQAAASASSHCSPAKSSPSPTSASWTSGKWSDCWNLMKSPSL